MKRNMILFSLCFLLILTPVLFATSNADVAPNQKVLTKSSSSAIIPGHHLENTLKGTRGVLLAQIPDTLLAAGYLSQLDSLYPFDCDLTDDIDPTGLSWSIDSITTWWHNWNGFTNWDNVPNIHFLVYEDSGIGTPIPKNVAIMEIVVEKADYVATEIDSAAGQWRIDMTFLTPVVIPGGAKYWIEVQPSNVLSVNGQTGLMGQTGIGNLQESYLRCPALGYNDWTNATTVFGSTVEAGFVLYGNELIGNYFWDFEDGPQGWIHTNGQAFPEGWAVQASGLHSNAVSPDPGDSSMWIDSDAAGGVTIFDTCYSPVVVPPTNMQWFKWGCGYQNYAGADTFTVCFQTFSGGVWQTPVEVARYNSDIGPNILDSVDVSAYMTADSIQLFFTYNNGNNSWYASFDNIFLFAPIGHDVGITAITGPPSGFAGPGDYDVIATIHNFGPVQETFNVTATVYDTTDSWNLVFTQTITLTDFASLADTTHTFGLVTFADAHIYYTEVYTELVDEVPFNDTLSQYTGCTTTFWEIGTDMPYTSSGPYAGYSTIGGNLCLHVFGGNPGPQNNHYIFDGTSWTAGTVLPTASTYGGYCSVDNKIYMIGARTAGPDGLITIYDVELDTYATKSLPGTIGDPAIATKDNNYIYIIGGCRPSGWVPTTIVMLYDIAGDSFFTSVTQLPAADARTCATAGYIGNDTIIVAGGIDNTKGYTNVTLIGVVDPTDPANITWSHGIDKPGTGVYRLGGDVWNDKFYVTGGSPYTAETHVYESNVGWTTLPDKPTACSNFGCVMVPVSTTKANEGQLTTSGGYIGSYLSVFEIYHTADVTGIRKISEITPDRFTVKLLSPAITSGEIKISLTMQENSFVHFSVINTAGRTIIKDTYSSISAGNHTLTWNAKDSNGKKVPAGTYFYHIETKNNTATGKLVIIK
ncbi:T9SS type A sorting domain-containing protein [candidate division WOR-3 bacterium]|nr:T9SS type A sorting domain-containing protein [candidate division WOR-3 bacterium]